jgi:quercetin dioxygenase-like cupin family protein
VQRRHLGLPWLAPALPFGLAKDVLFGFATTVLFGLATLVLFGSLTVAQAQTSYPPPYPRPTARSVLQNDRVNIWDVTWPKGEPTPMHQHTLDQLSITLRPGIIRLTTPGRPPTEGSSRYASVTFVRHGTIHQEEGRSDIPQHKIMLELKPSAAPEAAVPGTSPGEGAVQLLDNQRLVAWDLTWHVGEVVHRPAEALDTVTVILEPGTLHTDAGDKAVAQGDVIYTPHGAPASTEEATAGSPRAIIVELK